MKSARTSQRVFTILIGLACLAACRSKVHIGVDDSLYPIVLLTKDQDLRWVSTSAFKVGFIGPKPCVIKEIDAKDEKGYELHTRECSKPKYGFFVYTLNPEKAKSDGGKKTTPPPAPPIPSGQPGNGVMVVVDPCKHSCPGNNNKSQQSLVDAIRSGQQPIGLYCDPDDCKNNPIALAYPSSDPQITGLPVSWQRLGDIAFDWTVTFDEGDAACTGGPVTSQSPSCTANSVGTHHYKIVFSEKDQKTAFATGEGYLVVTAAPGAAPLNK